jgi:hypothetical protein
MTQKAGVQLPGFAEAGEQNIKALQVPVIKALFLINRIQVQAWAVPQQP